MVDISDWKNLSEIFKNLAQGLAVIGGAWALVIWLYQRRDRAADVLLQLEKTFAEASVRDARKELEDDIRYRELSPILVAAVNKKPLTQDEADKLTNIDALLRFYVVLLGIRRSRQVPDASLKTCYRYWLGLYHHPERQEFKTYVDSFFRTLKEWLKDDAERGTSRRFFS